MNNAKFLLLLLTLAFSPFLTGCATTPANPDPWEGLNRKTFAFNEVVDKAVLKPLAKGYTAITPAPVEKGVSNVLDNLFYPTVIVNQLLQGKATNAIKDTTRFLVNSTVGLLGIFDVASKAGLPAHREDFGQTLAVWGITNSPYLVLPILGPSTARDGVGRVADTFTNPIFYVNDTATRYALVAMATVDTRARQLKAESIISGDKYLFLRDAYLQRRHYQINDGRVEEQDPFLADQ